jgi:HEAT repeat protein
VIVIGGIILSTLIGVATAQETFLGRSVDDWKKQGGASDAQERILAAWAIAQVAGNSANQVSTADLAKLTSDADPTVRYWGVLGLSSQATQSKDPAAAVAVLEPLLIDKAPGPRIAAAQALGLLGRTDKSLPVLVAAMSEPQESVRIQAVAALEKLGPAARPAADTLQKARSDTSEYVKRISERAAARLETEKK